MTQQLIDNDRLSYAAAFGVQPQDIDFRYFLKGFWAFNLDVLDFRVSGYWRSTTDFVWLFAQGYIHLSPFVNLEIYDGRQMPDRILAALFNLFDADGIGWQGTLAEYSVHVTSHDVLEWNLDFKERLEELKANLPQNISPIDAL